MKHSEFDSLLPAYCLGALAPREAARMRRHLAEGCQRCESRVRGYGRVAAVLPLAAAERSPRPELKAALLRSIEPTRKRAGWRLTWVWPALASGLAACALLGWFWARPQGAPPVAVPAPAPRLTLRAGSVTQSGRAVAPGGSLDWGVVVAVKGGDARVQVGRQAVLLLRAGTRLSLTQEGGAVVADLPHGTLFSAVRPGTAFGVRAGDARVDAQGTVFLVRHVVERRAYVCICRGRIQVRAPGLDRVMAAADDAQESGLDLTLGPGPSVATAAKPAYYTDEEEDGLKDALRDAMGVAAAPADPDDKKAVDE